MNLIEEKFQEWKQALLLLANEYYSVWHLNANNDVFLPDFWNFKPASIDQLEFAEERTGFVFPADYRWYLLNIGEFVVPGFGNDGKILGVHSLFQASSLPETHPGVVSRINEMPVLNSKLTKDGQHSPMRLGRAEFGRTLIISDDNNSGRTTAMLAPTTVNRINYEFIIDDAWSGSRRFHSFGGLIDYIYKESLRTLASQMI